MVGMADNVKTIFCHLCCLLHNPKSMLKGCVLQPYDLGNQTLHLLLFMSIFVHCL